MGSLDCLSNYLLSQITYYLDEIDLCSLLQASNKQLLDNLLQGGIEFFSGELENLLSPSFLRRLPLISLEIPFDQFKHFSNLKDTDQIVYTLSHLSLKSTIENKPLKHFPSCLSRFSNLNTLQFDISYILHFPEWIIDYTLKSFVDNFPKSITSLEIFSREPFSLDYWYSVTSLKHLSLPEIDKFPSKLPTSLQSLRCTVHDKSILNGPEIKQYTHLDSLHLSIPFAINFTLLSLPTSLTRLTLKLMNNSIQENPIYDFSIYPLLQDINFSSPKYISTAKINSKLYSLTLNGNVKVEGLEEVEYLTLDSPGLTHLTPFTVNFLLTLDHVDVYSLRKFSSLLQQFSVKSIFIKNLSPASLSKLPEFMKQEDFSVCFGSCNSHLTLPWPQLNLLPKQINDSVNYSTYNFHHYNSLHIQSNSSLWKNALELGLLINSLPLTITKLKFSSPTDSNQFYFNFGTVSLKNLISLKHLTLTSTLTITEFPESLEELDIGDGLFQLYPPPTQENSAFTTPKDKIHTPLPNLKRLFANNLTIENIPKGLSNSLFNKSNNNNNKLDSSFNSNSGNTTTNTTTTTTRPKIPFHQVLIDHIVMIFSTLLPSLTTFSVRSIHYSLMSAVSQASRDRNGDSKIDIIVREITHTPFPEWLTIESDNFEEKELTSINLNTFMSTYRSFDPLVRFSPNVVWSTYVYPTPELVLPPTLTEISVESPTWIKYLNMAFASELLTPTILKFTFPLKAQITLPKSLEELYIVHNSSNSENDIHFDYTNTPNLYHLSITIINEKLSGTQPSYGATVSLNKFMYNKLKKLTLTYSSKQTITALFDPNNIVLPSLVPELEELVLDFESCTISALMGLCPKNIGLLKLKPPPTFLNRHRFQNDISCISSANPNKVIFIEALGSDLAQMLYDYPELRTALDSDDENKYDYY